MPCLDFPANPALGQNFSFYHWNGSSWVVGAYLSACTQGIFDGGNFDSGITLQNSQKITLDGGNADTGVAVPSCIGVVDGGVASVSDTDQIADLQSQIDLLTAQIDDLIQLDADQDAVLAETADRVTDLEDAADMPITFPSNPAVNDTYLGWYWNGFVWKLSPGTQDPREVHGHYSYQYDSAVVGASVDKADGWVEINPTISSYEEALPTSMAAVGTHWLDANNSGFSLAGTSQGGMVNLSVSVGFDFASAHSTGSVRFKVRANSSSSNAVFYLTASDSVASTGKAGEDIHQCMATLPIKSFMVGDTVAAAGWFSVEVSTDGPASVRIINGEYQFFL